MQTRRRYTPPSESQNTTYLYNFSSLPSKLLTWEEEIALGKRVQSGDINAVNTLICSNLRFVAAIAKEYRYKPFKDTVSDGIMGLIEAARRFNPDKNVRFVSYAVWWIRQSIMQHMLDDKMIKVSKRTIAKIRQLTKQSNNSKLSATVSAGIGASRDCFSLDRKINENSELFFIDTIKSRTNIQNEIIKNDLKKYTKQAIKKLTNRERDIIVHRFGLDDKTKWTLQKLADKYGITKERVRQIQNTVFEKLKEEFDDYC